MLTATGLLPMTHEGSRTRRMAAALAGCLILAGCGAPAPPPPLEPRPAYVLEGKIYDGRERPVSGITVHVFPVGEAEPIGSTRSDSTGTYRIEVDHDLPPGRLLVLVNSNRHVHHDGRFMPMMDRLSPPETAIPQRRLFYLTPSSDVQPPRDADLYVIKPLCNVRSAPDTESAVVAQVKKGQAVRYLERVGDWYWVELRDGTRGWIHRMLVTTPDHRMPE